MNGDLLQISTSGYFVPHNMLDVSTAGWWVESQSGGGEPEPETKICTFIPTFRTRRGR
jgi:hypothetical protein